MNEPPAPTRSPDRTIDFRGQSFSLAKRLDLGNPSRILPPDETLRKVRPLFAAIGLTRLGNITGLDRVGIPVAVSIRPNSYSLVQSSGKGVTLASALTSAAMESIELHCAEHIALERTRATYRDLQQSVTTLDIDELSLSRHSLFHADRPEEWVFGWDVTTQQEVAVPYHAVTLDFRVMSDLRCFASFQIDSNGLASGNHFLEALLAALLELVERDGVSCHYEAELRGYPRRRIRLETLEDETIRRLVHLLNASGLEPFVVDCSTDIAVPVFEAYLFDPHSNIVPVAQGYGAHLDPYAAIVRALTEAAQGRTLTISGARDDLFKEVYSAFRSRHAKSVKALHSNYTYVPMTHVDRSTGSFQADILHILERLREVGLRRVIVVDLSPPDADISVLRVIVPGLEGYHSYAFVPGARARRFVESHCRLPAAIVDDVPVEPSDQSTHRPAGGFI